MPERSWCTVERFDYSPLAGRWSVVRMLAALEAELQPPSGPKLLVTAGSQHTSHGAFVSAADRRSTQSGSQLLWIASFAVPLEVVEYPRAVFELAATGLPAIGLPAPGTLVPAAAGELELAARRWLSTHARRRVTALATAVAVSTASIPATGLAATQARHGIVTAPTGGAAADAPAFRNPAGKRRVTLTLPRVADLERHPQAHLPGPVPLVKHKLTILPPRPAPTAPTTGDPTGTTPTGTTPPSTTPTGTTPPSTTPTGTTPTGTTPPSTTPTGTTPPSTTPPGTTPAAPGSPPAAASPAPKKWSTASTGPDRPAGKHLHRSAPKRTHIVPTGGAPIAPSLTSTNKLQPVPASVAPASVAPAGEDGNEPAGSGSGGFSGVGTGVAGETGSTSTLSSAPPASLLSRLFADVNGPPPFLVSIYKRAGHRYDIPWPVLAAINSVETNYGRDLSVSSAGAVGWMQFMPGTWREYGVDANRDGKADPNNPTDAIFAAARYLRASGARTDLRGAIFAYNHATWYVDEVLLRARWIAANSTMQVKGLSGRKVAAMTAMAELLVGRPYVWGGGHAGWQIVPGYDCSGFVSAVLHAAGYLSSPQTTDTLPSQPGIGAGPGRYVTIFDRTAPGTQGHVIIDLNGTFYESGGSAASGGGAGVKKIGQPPYDYLLSFDTILHPAGL